MLLDRILRPRSPSDLTRLPGIDLIRSTSKHIWTLQNAAGDVIDTGFEPRYTADDMFALRQAALDGIGMAQLPDYIVAEQVGSGSLEVVLPQWMLPVGVIHAVFASRRGLSPAVRSFLDFLAAEFRNWTQAGSSAP